MKAPTQETVITTKIVLVNFAKEDMNSKLHPTKVSFKWVFRFFEALFVHLRNTIDYYIYYVFQYTFRYDKYILIETG